MCTFHERLTLLIYDHTCDFITVYNLGIVVSTYMYIQHLIKNWRKYYSCGQIITAVMHSYFTHISLLFNGSDTTVHKCSDSIRTECFWLPSDTCGTMTYAYFRCSVMEAGFSVVWSSHVAVLNLSACYSRWPTNTRIVISSSPFHNSHLVRIFTVISSPSLHFSGHHTLWPQRSDKRNESQQSVNEGRSILFISVSTCSAANNFFRQTKVPVTLMNWTF